ncbi:MAG: hypothetical protein Cons2KO_19130 [Congregibacter sp.]
MSTDRRKNDRGTPDRRHETRTDVSVLGYILAVLGLGILLSAFWALVY